MKVRLQRFMADCGVASRRECEAMIAQGRVQVNGEVRTAMPVMVDPERDIIAVDQRPVEEGGAGGGGVDALQPQAVVYYLLNKPKGVLVTNYDPSDRKTVGELMKGVKERLFPVGRLEMDSRGALIMTNDGELANRLAHPRYGLEKTYIVEADGRLGPEDIEKIKKGMWLGPERGHQGAARTERFKVKVLGRERGRTNMEIRVSEGRSREVRRVMARLGHPVRDLNRVAIGGKVTIKGLEVGEYRALTQDEVKWLLYASSPEYHDRERSATQAWYEAKEMEKERKRLAAEEAKPRAAEEAPVARPVAAVFDRYKPRPVRKGRKPFVPPSGRNAGRVLGGSKRNRREMEKRLERALREGDDGPGTAEREVRPMERPAGRGADLPRGVGAAHPLGRKARSDGD